MSEIDTIDRLEGLNLLKKKTGKRKRRRETNSRSRNSRRGGRRSKAAGSKWPRGGGWGTMWVRFWAKFRAFAIIYNRGRPP